MAVQEQQVTKVTIQPTDPYSFRKLESRYETSYPFGRYGSTFYVLTFHMPAPKDESTEALIEACNATIDSEQDGMVVSAQKLAQLKKGKAITIVKNEYRKEF